MNRKTICTTLLVTFLAFLTIDAAPAAAKTYEVDKAHSSVGFSVRHMAISNVKGFFGDFEASFSYDPADPDSWQVSAVIQTTSVNTGNEKRDDHLRNEDFFDVARFPTITFESTAAELGADGKGRLEGNLTMNGVTKEVVLDLELLGALEKSPFGDSRAGFTATGKLNRKDFGLTWNRAMETGGVMVGEDITITIEVEGVSP